MHTKHAFAPRMLLLIACAASWTGCAGKLPQPSRQPLPPVPASLREPPEQSNYLDRALADIQKWRETLNSTQTSCEDGNSCSGQRTD